jgi:hypothetical protein
MRSFGRGAAPDEAGDIRVARAETNQSDRVLIVIDGRKFSFSPFSVLYMG